MAVHIDEFTDRIEVRNAGGLYGVVNKQTFPNLNDYRNPILAEAMHNLNFVNKFNYGIKRAQNVLAENGNPPAEFDISSESAFIATLKINPTWQSE
jgi:ATP-dependent DNA helicase RecG